MDNGDFLLTIKELNKNRGVTIKEIARQLAVPRNWIYTLLKLKTTPSAKLKARADIVFPMLLRNYPKLPNRKQYTDYGITLERFTHDSAKKNEEWRNKILKTIEGGTNTET